MKYAALFFALMACMTQSLQAQEGWTEQDTVEEPTEKERLLAFLEEQTAIATRTKMNVDYVPGMVTVLHGYDLEARGIRTVWEALSLVPGIEQSIESTGRRKVLVRGIGLDIASGNVKILLNDVSMNSAERAFASPVLDMAIEQVDRVEVIRGPGSAIYGEYAYMGVINVVTRAEEDRLYGFGGSFNTAGLGGNWFFSSPDSPVKASLNLAAWRTSGADSHVDSDALHLYGGTEFSNAPGPADEDVDAGTAVFQLSYDRFSLSAQWSQDGLGDFFGVNDYLPPDPDRITQRIRHRTVDMRQELPLTRALTAGIQLEWKDVERKGDHFFINPSFEPTYPGLVETYLDSYYLETVLSLATDFLYRGWEKHAVLLAASTSTVRVDESRAAFDPSNSEPIITVPEGTTRSITAMTLQDEYRHSDLFTLTTGLRYDDYSDVGVNYSPRIAAVWRLNDHHILKSQYAEAFRPPTLLEMESRRFFDETPLDPATIRTSEVGYIFKGNTLESRVTAFYSKLDHVPTFGQEARAIWSSNRSATTWGLEWEQRWRVSRQWRVDGNLSYADARDEKTHEPFPNSTSWMANAGLAYEKGRFEGAIQAHYISGYFRYPEDHRSNLSGYTTVDVTGTFRHLLARGVDLRVGIKNLFDEDVRDPADVRVIDSTAYLRYSEDLPRPGRSAWAQLSYGY